MKSRLEEIDALIDSLRNKISVERMNYSSQLMWEHIDNLIKLEIEKHDILMGRK